MNGMMSTNLKHISAGDSGHNPGDAEVEPLLLDCCPERVLAPAVVVYTAKPPAANGFL